MERPRHPFGWRGFPCLARTDRCDLAALGGFWDGRLDGDQCLARALSAARIADKSDIVDDEVEPRAGGVGRDIGAARGQEAHLLHR